MAIEWQGAGDSARGVEVDQVGVAGGAQDGREGVVVADAVGDVGAGAEDVGDQGQEDGDAVGEVEVFGVVGVDVDRFGGGYVGEYGGSGCEEERGGEGQ